MNVAVKAPQEAPKAILAGGVDFYSQAFIDNPYPYYAKLRAEQPVCFVEALNGWFLTRYPDVRMAMIDERFGIDFDRLQVNRMGPGVVDQLFFKFGREFMAFSDPPHHSTLKNLFVQGFTRARAEQSLPEMRAIVNGVIDEFIDDGHADITHQLAHEAPLRIISSVLGVPRQDQAMLEGWVQDYVPVIGFPPMTDEQTRRANAATQGFNDYFIQVLDERRKRPGTDLISELLARNRESEAPIDEFQVVSNLMLIYFAGQDTQKGHVGNLLVALHENPDQLAPLLEDPKRVWDASNELMRYDGVSQITARVAMEDLEIGGTAIAKGQTVLLGVGAANRDPTVFPDPDRMDLSRPEARLNLSFGAGRHACLGAGFARLSVPLMLEGLLSRIPTLKVDFAKLQRNRTLSKRGYGSIPVSWT